MYADYFLEELTDDEKAEMKKASDRYKTQQLIAHKEWWQNTNRELMETCKAIVKRRITKEVYTDKDKEVVELALGIIKSCEAEIKKSDKEIYLIAKYPVGSKRRPVWWKNDSDRQAKNNFIGGAYNEIDKILKENN